MAERTLTRRRFTIGAAAATAAFVLGLKVSEPSRAVLPISSLNQLRGFDVLPFTLSVAPVLAGITPNHPWLWEQIDSREKIDKELEKAGKMPTKLIRIFLDDRVEPALGRYQRGFFDKVAMLSERVDLQVDLFDAYNLLHSDRPSLSYSSKEPTSPYLGRKEGKSLTDRKRNFFQDPAMVEAFQKRVFTLVSHLKDARGIKVWSVGNEFEAPTEVLSDWYAKILPVIREIDDRRPVVAGVADPTLLDEGRLAPLGLSANTIHIYPDIVNRSLEKIMDRYINAHSSTVPLICQEIGFPDFPGNIGHDWLYSQFLNQALLNLVEVNQRDSWVRPLVAGLGLYRLSTGEEEPDGHEIIPDELPETMSVVWRWNEIMEKANFPSSNAA